jgi:cysteine desulfurase
VEKYLFFDSASTTPCCEEAARLVEQFSTLDYGNPSSVHAYGQKAARVIRDARSFFAKTFQVEPNQIIFTGSGTEANNLAIYGVALAQLARQNSSSQKNSLNRVLISSLEHPAVRKPAESLSSLGFETQRIPVTPECQIDIPSFLELLTPSPLLVSIQQVNNIVGAHLPVEELAQICKAQAPNAIFHVDAVQAFGKVKLPKSPSKIDLISISGHKFGGPKGIGALIILNKKLLQNGLRPLIWGGGQENGFRSGTQNSGLIAGFHISAQKALQNSEENWKKVSDLKTELQRIFQEMQLTPMYWNSPENAVPHIISLSFPGYAAGPLSRLLEERGCLVSVGSACSSKKPEPDPVLSAMGLSLEVQRSTLRVSLSQELSKEDLKKLVQAFADSLERMKLLEGKLR